MILQQDDIKEIGRKLDGILRFPFLNTGKIFAVRQSKGRTPEFSD